MKKRITVSCITFLVTAFLAVLLFPVHTSAAHGPGLVTWEELVNSWSPQHPEYSNVYFGTPAAPSKRVIATNYYYRGRRSTGGDSFYGYDAFGNMVSAIQMAGTSMGVETFEYDSQGRVTRHNIYSYNGTQLSSWTIYSRNEQGQIIRATSYNEDSPSGDGYGHVDYNYSGGRLVSYNSAFRFGSGMIYGSVQFGYDAFGNLVTEVSDNYANIMEYDSLGRLVKGYTYRGGALDRTAIFSYDKDGYLSKIVDGNVTSVYVYEPVAAPAPVPVPAPGQYIDGFDPAYYGLANPDVVAILGNDPATLYNHYLLFGKAEGRLPAALK